jgi:hypothetical protein
MSMLNLPEPYLLALIGSGLFWSITYILIIRRGHMDKAHGMPLWALALNFAWEFNYAFITPSPAPQLYVNIVWCLLDVVILVHFLRFCRVDYPDLDVKKTYGLVALAFVVCWLAVVACQMDTWPLASPDYPLGMGRAYSAWGMNVSMSILFVYFIIGRKSVRGQSIYIAIAKWLGTICAWIPFVLYCGLIPGMPVIPGTPEPTSWFFPLTYAATFIFDVIYICQIYFQCKKEGINPWKRV